MRSQLLRSYAIIGITASILHTVHQKKRAEEQQRAKTVKVAQKL